MNKYILIFIVITGFLFFGFRAYDYFNSLAPKNYNFLKKGDNAPDFLAKSIQISDDNSGSFITEVIRLSNFRGKKVILYFYPKDNTPFCTKQAKSFRDNYTTLRNAGYEIIGVSTDDDESHKKFISDHSLPFKLITDTDRTIHEKYRAWSSKSFFWLGKKSWKTNRMTFIIGRDGKIKDVIIKVESGNHAQQVMKNDSEYSKI